MSLDTPKADDYDELRPFAQHVYKSMEANFLSTGLEFVGANLRSHSNTTDGAKQWWAFACRPTNIPLSNGTQMFKQWCEKQTGEYNENTGFCWKDKEPLFIAYLTDNGVGYCNTLGYETAIITMQPNGDKQKWRDWLISHAKTMKKSYGCTRFDGEKVDVCFDQTDIRKLDTRLVLYLKDQEATEKLRTEKLKQEYIRNKERQAEQIQRRRNIKNETNKPLIQNWKQYGVGTKVCRNRTYMRFPATEVGFIEDFSDTKAKIRVFRLQVQNVVVPEFREYVSWEYPSDNWYICE